MISFKEYLIEKDELKNITFVRYGGLSSVKQKGKKSPADSFHHPPANRGVYAFVKQFVEPFLLGTEEFDSRRQEWLKDKKGNRIESPQLSSGWDVEERDRVYAVWDKYDKYSTSKEGDKYYYYKDKKPKTFTYKGELWHHLDVPHNEILKRKGSWVLTDMQTYKKALRKEAGVQARARYSKDHMEVFIEKI